MKFVSAARLRKAQERVIAAMPRILARHPEALYLIVGDGDDQARLRSKGAEIERELPEFDKLVGKLRAAAADIRDGGPGFNIIDSCRFTEQPTTDISWKRRSLSWISPLAFD